MLILTFPGLRFASTWAMGCRPFGPENSPKGLKGQYVIAQVEAKRRPGKVTATVRVLKGRHKT
jgi:hypothetical protein